jgi:hypothetical protein
MFHLKYFFTSPHSKKMFNDYFLIQQYGNLIDIDQHFEVFEMVGEDMKVIEEEEMKMEDNQAKVEEIFDEVV